MPATSRGDAGRTRKVRGLFSGGLVTATMLVFTLVPVSPAASQDTGADPLAPVDAQAWVDQEDLTWDAYTPVPGQPAGWKDGSVRGTQNDYTGAVVLLDYADQPFLITQDPEDHPFGNPQPGWEPVPESEVGEWMHEYLTVPNDYNGGQSISGYWMEDTHGKISVDLTTFGPYHLTGKVHEYGLAGHAPVAGPGSRCPLGDVCNKDIRQEGGALWKASEGPTIDTEFDFIFYVTAGHDESSTWQEFGEMTVETREDVPDALGPPGAGGPTPPLNNAGEQMPNWAPTRYVPWTSWRAAANHWPNASGGSTTQAESSGQSVFAHEFSHVRSLPDNYNNPFANDARAGAGYWEMMDRGTFNGPGGTHNRWQVPNAGGSGLGPSHMVHFKQDLGVLDPDDQVLLDRAQLASQGIAVTTLQARSSVPDQTPVALEVALNGYTPGKCETGNPDPSFWCPRGTAWNEYTMEVVDRVGNDSFAPGHGVLLAQARPSGIPEEWIIDANPQDINMIDFYRPDGTPVPVVRGDPRQLNDATFHAGTGSGSEFEYVDEFNKLHFYILDTFRDANGILNYSVAVRNLDGAGAFTRGVSLGQASATSLSEEITQLDVPLTNTGEAGTGTFDSDVYRISATVDGAGWNVHLPYEVRAAGAGETVPLQAFATRASDAAESALVTITATSEADPTKTQSITVELSQEQDAGAQESTLTLAVAGKGGNRTLVARLASAADPTQPIAGKVISFYTSSGTLLGQSTTNADGVATLPLPKSYRKRPVIAEFAGDSEWLAASATAGT